jgi:hypothetical protein
VSNQSDPTPGAGKYNIRVKGSVGQVGDNNTATGMVVTNSGTVLSSSYVQVLEDLQRLREVASQRIASGQLTQEQRADLDALDEACSHASKGDGSGVLDAAKRFGTWLIAIAKDIGVAVAADVLKGKLGLP